MTFQLRYAGTAVLFIGIGLCCPAILGQARAIPNNDVTATYERLLSQIKKIPIIDMHAHPGYWDDPDVDAMAVTPTELDPARTRVNNPEWLAAFKALYGYPYSDTSAEHIRWLHEKDDELRKQWGDQFLPKMLDKIGIQLSIANRVAMDYLENSPRFRFVFFVDPFMFPFSNEGLAINPDRAVYFPIQEKALHRYLRQAGVQDLPGDLPAYEAVIRKVLEMDKQQNGVAIKFEAPYFRSLVNISDPPREQAEAIYKRYRGGGKPSDADYVVFQDYVFRFLIAQAGLLHLQVHIHSAVGSGNYYRLSEGNAMDLENILRDPRYKDITFVMIHGGYPYDQQSIWLAALPNVFLDSSEFSLLVFPQEYSRILKRWLEIFPEKIVFGSDAFPYSREVNVPATYWLAVQTARSAVAAALAEMVCTGEITEGRALQIARGYFHDNTARLLGIDVLSTTLHRQHVSVRQCCGASGRSQFEGAAQ